ncbi:MAG: serine hydrolase domain-containing protein [Novosphingobium sp.]
MILSRRSLLHGSALLGAGAMLGLPVLARAADFGAIEGQWPTVTALLDRYVRTRKVAGGVATFGWGQEPLAAILRGREGFDDADPVSPQSLFRVYSMTKPITGMAAMMLIDEGKLGLDQRLADFVPEFANPRVVIDQAKGLDSRPAAGQITIRQLMTHTSGMGYAGVSTNAVGHELLRLGVTPARVSHRNIKGVTSPVPTPEPGEFLRRAASVPLLADPGTKWIYSMGLDVLGLVIQRASGAASFAAFLQERLFDPLGMKDSVFQVPKADEPRFTTNYGIAHGFRLTIDKPAESVFLDPPAFAYGGAGLVSTPVDYDRFLAMLVGGGTLGGRRIMSEKAVMLGMSNLLPPGADTNGTSISGAGFGAGGRVGLGPDAGTFGWSGAAGTVALVNSRVGLRTGLYVQYMPSSAYHIQKEFLAAAAKDALVIAERKVTA